MGSNGKPLFIRKRKGDTSPRGGGLESSPPSVQISENEVFIINDFKEVLGK